MPKTRLQLVNSVLALVGENQLLSTAGNLGSLVVDTINTSIANIVQETRSQVFESTLAANVTSPDYLTAALTLPDNTAQVYSVLLRVSTGLASGDKLFSLDYAALEDTPNEPSYSVVGKQLFVSPMVARPFTLRVHVLTIPVLPTNDTDDSGLPDIVIPAVQHAAAAIIALSYLDDPNQASVHRNVAEQLTAKLRQQYGNNRAKTFNVGGSKKGLLGFGGVSSITGGVAYATAADATLTGNATLNGSPLVNQNGLATTLGSYLTSATAASTYLTQANAASTYLPTTTAASTYLTQTNAASTYLTQTNAASTYLTQTNAASTYAAIQAFKPVLIATRTVNQTLVSGNNLLIFNNVTTDTDSAYNSSTGVFTVPAGKGGLYQMTVNATVNLTASTSGNVFCFCRFRVNGSAIGQISNVTYTGVASAFVNASGTLLRILNPGDTITVDYSVSHTGSSPTFTLNAGDTPSISIVRLPF